MTVRFRIDAVALDTTDGPVRYRFTSDLTVLAGPTAVGKTTLLELIKFGFGAKATLAPVAVDHVEMVTLDVEIGNDRLRLSRSLDRSKGKKIRVTDLISQERLPDHNVGDKQPTLNTLLLKCLGLSDDMRAAAGGSSTRAGARITFFDILTYLYVPQSQINRDIAHSQESYREPKRKAVFELLFDITNTEILKLRSTVSELKGQIELADAEHNTVVKFLRDSGTDGREQSEAALEHAKSAQNEAQSRLAVLRESIDPISDRETQTLRDLLTEAERGLADTRGTGIELSRRHNQYKVERQRVQSDIDRLVRMREAGHHLANIEFLVCPRCMQSIQQRMVPPDTCNLCLQNVPMPVDHDHDHDHDEIRQLTEQLTDIDEQINAMVEQKGAIAQGIAEREQLVSHLTAMLDQRTTHRITPRLQAFSDASQQEAAAKTNQERWEAILRQWDRVADLQTATDCLRNERANKIRELELAEEAMQQRRERILTEISEQFDSTVRAIGIPGVITAAVDPDKYLPVINGKIFSRDNQLAGGTTTATQVAYWCSLLSVASRNTETAYPAFLLIDSPQLALNAEVDLASAMYRTLATQVGAKPGRLQIIVADNELPDSYRNTYAEINFDYMHPTVSTIDHPGPAQVTLIDDKHRDT